MNADKELWTGRARPDGGEPAPASAARATRVIAEMACSHEGDPVLARRIIDAAGEAGADAIQFQIWRVEQLVVPGHAERSLLERLELSEPVWRELTQRVRDHYPFMQIIACVYHPDAVDVAEGLGVDAYKLHSADLANPLLVRHAASTGRRIDLSTGGSTLGEIERALGWIEESSDPPVWLMYGFQGFPTAADRLDLRRMIALRELFGRPVAYQDHSDADTLAAFTIPAAALGLGVEIIEKHVTHDRSLKGVDHEAALNPDEFKRFVAMVHEIDAARGGSRRHGLNPGELDYRRYAKKSAVVARPLDAGATLGAHDLVFLRTGELGLAPCDAERFVGRRVVRSLPAYHMLREDDLA